ncbi:MAG: 50S ribosomal protein L19 [Nitrospirae bacterium]|nr:50S ribosomal protein L19 [Nitrospirota bacterium]
MNLLNAVEEGFKKDIPKFNVGDTVRIYVKVIEGDKERIQPFDGVVIARRGSNTRETFTVRKISFGIGIERIFPLFSPSIDKIEVLKKGDVRRAKLYYLREKKGKSAKIKEKDRVFEATTTESQTLES